MIDREFTKRIRLLNGRHETIKTKFQLEAGQLVEHVELQTYDRPACNLFSRPSPTTRSYRMIGRDFYRQVRLRDRRTETIRSRYELNEAGQLVEYVYVWVDWKPSSTGPNYGTTQALPTPTR